MTWKCHILIWGIMKLKLVNKLVKSMDFAKFEWIIVFKYDMKMSYLKLGDMFKMDEKNQEFFVPKKHLTDYVKYSIIQVLQIIVIS